MSIKNNLDGKLFFFLLVLDTLTFDQYMQFFQNLLMDFL